VANGKREVLLAPASADGVDVTAADTAALDLDIDIVVTERLGLELVLVEFEPGLGPINLESGELLGVGHLERCWMVRRRGSASEVPEVFKCGRERTD
jgi:hypothetical protein